MAGAVIVKYGNKALRVKALPVASVDDSIRRLVSEMLSVMYMEEGVGLAAEQIGRTESVFVVDIPKEESCGFAMPLAFINPKILEMDGEQIGQEGCLSFPGIHINIKRAERVRVVFMNLEGKEQTLEATGLLSRAIQHEYDHLNGVLLVDRMSAVQKVANAGKLKRMKRGEA